MSQQLPSWRTGTGQTLWLSMLIEAMEKLSRSCPVDRHELVAMQTRLAQPAMAHSAYGSRFSLQN